MFGDESQITLIFQCYMTFTPLHQQKVIEFSIFADFFYQCTLQVPVIFDGLIE